MKIHRVESPRWTSFVPAFSGSHHGWAASLEVRPPGQPARIEIDDSPFRRAALETRDGRSALVLTFGEEPEEYFAYIIRDPRILMAAEREDGSEASLIVEAGDGTRAVLLLLNAIPVEDTAGA